MPGKNDKVEGCLRLSYNGYFLEKGWCPHQPWE